MIFEKKLMPDHTFSVFSEVDADFLKSLGIRALISDIDNTLVPYEILDPTEEIRRWVKELKDAGIRITFVSNNHSERVERFNLKLGCTAYADVRKPSPKFLIRAMSEMGSGTRDTLFLGDQLLTDALAAHRAGIKAVIVPPIKDKKSLFFKAKRLIEKPYMRKYMKMKKL